MCREQNAVMAISLNTLESAFTGAAGNDQGAQHLTSDWERPPKNGQKLEGFSRSYIYRLIEAGSIKSMSITAPGAKKGVRLIHVPSLRAWIAAQAAAQESHAS
jgi:hypothetical protein